MLSWLNSHQDSLSGDCEELAVPLVVNLQDKNAPVRSAAELLLSFLVKKGHISMSGFEKATRDLSTASKRGIQSAMDRIISEADALTQQRTTDATELVVANEEVISRDMQLALYPAIGKDLRVREFLRKKSLVKVVSHEQDLLQLKSEWEVFLSADASDMLFGKSWNIRGLDFLTSVFDDENLYYHSDFIFRWLTIYLVTHAKHFHRSLTFLHHFFQSLLEFERYRLMDTKEIDILLPTLLQTCSNINQDTEKQFTDILRVLEVFSGT